VLSNTAYFSFLKLSVAVCEVAVMEGCNEVLLGNICQGERRYFLLNARPTHDTVSPYSFRICCISFRIDVFNICRWFRTQSFTFTFTITLYEGDSCHSVRMSISKIMYDRSFARIVLVLCDIWWWEKNVDITNINFNTCTNRQTFRNSYYTHNFRYIIPHKWHN
jgi:hypothetical protein